MRKKVSIETAISKIEHYCAYQERSHIEVKNKLASLGVYGHTADEIMAQLIQNDYLNETRFAFQFARGKFRVKKWGRIRIRIELKKRQVSEYNIHHSLNQIDPITYTNSFEQWARQKWENLSQNSRSNDEVKRKWIRYFQYRGWENELIYDMLRGLERKSSESDM